MITLRISTELSDDRTILLTLPPEVPTGKVELLVSISPQDNHTKRPRTSLAAWADANAEDWGDQLHSTNPTSFTGEQ